MADIAELRRLVEPVVTGMGFAPVRVALNGGAGAAVLQVMAEDPQTGQLTLDQCAEISRALSDALDEADPIDSEYRLEVSSPGIDRPLTRPADWDRWAGHEARVSVDEAIAGRKRFLGIVRGSAGPVARLEVAGLGELELPFDKLSGAKLVLTDALMKATRPLSTDDADDIVYDDAPADADDIIDGAPVVGADTTAEDRR